MRNFWSYFNRRDRKRLGRRKEDRSLGAPRESAPEDRADPPRPRTD